MPQWGERGEGDPGGRRVGDEGGQSSKEGDMEGRKSRMGGGQGTRVREQGSNRGEQVSPPLNKFGTPL